MSFRFWRRIKIAPGLTLNLSKTGGSLSVGPRGAKITVGPHGNRATAGIPGTGLFYTHKLQGSGAGNGLRPTRAAPAVSAQSRLNLGFFQRLVVPPEEKSFVDGCRSLALGDDDQALGLLKNAAHLADGAYLAGFLALKHDRDQEAAQNLKSAAEDHQELGRYFDKYGISATMIIPITPEVTAMVGADLRGVLLGLVEAFQRLQRLEDAMACLERLRQLEPDDVAVKLSLAELIMERRPHDKDACRRVVALAEGLANISALHAAILLYKGRALRGLGLRDGARETLNMALRRKKDRSPELMHALRYERAGLLEELGRAAAARADLEKIYAEDPGFADVAVKLGVS